MEPPETNWSKYRKTCGSQKFCGQSSNRVVITIDGNKPIDLIAAATKSTPCPPQSNSQLTQFPWIDAITQSSQIIANLSLPDKRKDQCKKLSPKQNQPEPDLRLSFLGAGETEKSASEKMGLSNAFADRCRSEPNTLIKRKARRDFEQRMKSKSGAAKKGDVVIDLTTSDNEDIAAASTKHSTEVQAKASDDISVDVGRSDGNDVADSFSNQQTSQQEQAKVSGNNKQELSEEEVRRLLWKYVVRAQEKEAAELKERNDKAAQEGTTAQQATDYSSDSEEYEDEPWTLDEDEELARWKVGGFSDEMLDWPTFHETRTWDDLMARLTWLETKHPKCWAALKALEDEEQELFERELSVEIEEMKAKGLLPSSSDEMSDDETEEESVEESDEEANRE